MHEIVSSLTEKLICCADMITFIKELLGYGRYSSYPTTELSDGATNGLWHVLGDAEGVMRWAAEELDRLEEYIRKHSLLPGEANHGGPNGD